MGELVGKVQDRLKRSSADLMTFALKFTSGVILSLVIAMIILTVLGKSEADSPLTFLFIIVAMSAVFMRIARKWSMTGVLIFDLICILVGMVLRLYIMVAPGA